MPTVKLNLSDRSYPIVIGENINKRLIALLKDNLSGNRLFVIYDSNFYALHGLKMNKLLKCMKPNILVVPSGEKSKSQKELDSIITYLLSEKISRSDFILAVGGGVISDLTGFAAASVLRGVNWGILSTSLLGMVDASIGGKTGINHKSGKNLIGTFWQPKFVVCDSYYLNTLPEREIICGLGEIVKYAGMIGEPMLDDIEKYLNHGDLYDMKSLTKLITSSVKLKANIVSKDEREGHLRMLLNLGHTIGHAIENSLGYGKLLHGEGVILGLWSAVELSKLLSTANQKELDKYQQLLESLMPLLPKRKIEADKLLEAMNYDKKRINKGLNFILLEKPGRPIITTDINKRQIRKSIILMLDKYDNRG